MKRRRFLACLAGLCLPAASAFGYYGVLRVDSIYLIDPSNPQVAENTAMDGTWWFQSDGTGDFTHTATLVMGTVSGWMESGPIKQMGDGSHHVSCWWSINTYHLGWFYGKQEVHDSDVAYAGATVTDVTQITDASLLTFTPAAIGPYGDAFHNGGVGSFIVWSNPSGVPEPFTIVSLGAGAIFLALRRRKP